MFGFNIETACAFMGEELPRTQSSDPQIRRSDGTPDKPGAYKVTARDAAAAGIYGHAAAALHEPEAVPLPLPSISVDAPSTIEQICEVDKHQPSHDIIAQTARTPLHPQGYPAVLAAPAVGEDDIPIVKAVNISPFTNTDGSSS